MVKEFDYFMVVFLFEGMSYVEIKMVCFDIFKEFLLNDVLMNIELVKMVVDKWN